MNPERKKTIRSNQISKIYTLRLNGYPQKVLIEGKSKDLPVVITLHGGPGTPLPFSVGSRGMFPAFTDRFIMVYWDQLGCGINNHVIDDNFHISAFVGMTCDLIRKIRKRFPKNPIFIFSTSWGSVLSALMPESMQKIVSGVVVSGQIVRNLFFNDETLSVLERSKIPQKKLEILKHTNPQTASPKDVQLISSCLMKYTNAYQNQNGKAKLAPVIFELLTSPDYRFRDFKAILINGYRHNTVIWHELLNLDLTDVLSRIRIPYVMVQGETDVVASTKNVADLVNTSGNPHLQYHVVKNVGHFPNEEAMKLILSELCRISQ